MDIERSLRTLEEKDTSATFQALKELEALADSSDALYPHTDRFESMLASDKYVLRVRGFRLFCRQARWDTDNVMDKHLDFALDILQDERPTAVRQALAALQHVVLYKRNLREPIRRRVLEIDCLRYKDTMHSLIAKDIEDLLKAMEEG